MGHASSEGAFGAAELGTVAVPSLDEINADAEFEGREISSAEFEEAWKKATT